jgi:hypothetical protein
VLLALRAHVAEFSVLLLHRLAIPSCEKRHNTVWSRRPPLRFSAVDGKCYAKHRTASARYLSSLSHTTHRFSANQVPFRTSGVIRDQHHRSHQAQHHYTDKSALRFHPFPFRSVSHPSTPAPPGPGCGGVNFAARYPARASPERSKQPIHHSLDTLRRCATIHFRSCPTAKRNSTQHYSLSLAGSPVGAS